VIDDDAVLNDQPIHELLILRAVMLRSGLYEVECSGCGAHGWTCDFIWDEGDWRECWGCYERNNDKERIARGSGDLICAPFATLAIGIQ